MKKTDLYLLLSTKTALLGAVTPSLRAVTVQFDKDDNKIYLHFFYDEEISEELFDISSTPSAEVQPEPGISYYTFNDNFVVQYN